MKLGAIMNLDSIATELIGDGGRPNLYFVIVGDRVRTVTTNGKLAYREWKRYAERNKECLLEDRRHGTLCSVEPESDEPGAKLTTIDDFPSWR